MLTEPLPPLEQMTPAARKLRAFYARTPGAPLVRREFWLMPETIEAWKKQGMPADAPWEELFLLDPPGEYCLRDLGWCEAGLEPRFEERVIEDRGECEVVQDFAGRHVLYFKNRRSGFMPEYVDHPVKDWKSWEETIKWRMNPATPARYAKLPQRMAQAQAAAAQGWMMNEGLVGGFMYLRSLFGPEEILYAVHDQPDLVHDCMKTWLALADAVIARHQEAVTLDEIIFAEDITYNHGPLISPDMIREFLFPYYQQLIANLKRRQRDRTRFLHVHLDTDGFCDSIIPLYREGIGMDFMSPFEVASGSDVVRTGREHPDLLMSGGIDKRVLARSQREIDDMLERILPPLRERGGYIPTVDHGVPAEVPYENYLHYRKRCVELGG
jgi:uroporphyrinogen decarboxylase